jgi:hypothetical protein
VYQNYHNINITDEMEAVKQELSKIKKNGKTWDAKKKP